MKKALFYLLALLFSCTSCYCTDCPDPNTPTIWKLQFGFLLPTISIVLISISIYYLITSKIDKENNKNIFKVINIFDFLIYAFWIMVPPLYFLVEYIHIFPDSCKLNNKAFEDLKYTQELGSKVWAGFIVILTTILYAKYKKEINL